MLLGLGIGFRGAAEHAHAGPDRRAGSGASAAADDAADDGADHPALDAALDDLRRAMEVDQDWPI